MGYGASTTSRHVGAILSTDQSSEEFVASEIDFGFRISGPGLRNHVGKRKLPDDDQAAFCFITR